LEIAEKIHQWVRGDASSHELLEYINQAKNAQNLTKIYEYLHEKYDYSLHEIISSKLSVEELYAISATEKFIRNPNPKNREKRDEFYREIGFEPHC
jgi:hypothetical protein